MLQQEVAAAAAAAVLLHGEWCERHAAVRACWLLTPPCPWQPVPRGEPARELPACALSPGDIVQVRAGAGAEVVAVRGGGTDGNRSSEQLEGAVRGLLYRTSRTRLTVALEEPEAQGEEVSHRPTVQASLPWLCARLCCAALTDH